MRCSYCGKGNTKEAAFCKECGSSLVRPTPEDSPPPPWGRVATLESEVEAKRLEYELNGKGIPHIITTYGDTAFGGLYQASLGWGYIEAPVEMKEEVLKVLRENGLGVTVCEVDGQLVQATIEQPVAERSFFRWKVVSISLLILSILYWGAALLNFWIARVMWQREEEAATDFVWAAVWHSVIALSCFGGRQCIKSSNPQVCGAGALLVAFALLTTFRIWLGAFTLGTNPDSFFEPLFVFPWLVYAIIFAVKKIRMKSNVGLRSPVLKDET